MAGNSFRDALRNICLSRGLPMQPLSRKLSLKDKPALVRMLPVPRSCPGATSLPIPTIAMMAEQNATADALEWWRKAYEKLARMKQRGIMLPTDEPYLAQLKAKLGMR
jgi:hypothetical protein